MGLLRGFMSRAGGTGLGLLTLLIAAGCDVGQVGGTVGPDGNNNIANCANRGTPGTAHTHSGVATNPTHAGEGCIAVGCHLTGQLGGGAGAMTAAGTVYKADGTTPNPGSVVRVKSGTTTLTAIADDAGNFAVRQAFTFPATTDTTACPTITPMSGQLSQGNGNCNGSSCHATGSTTGVIKFE